MAIQILAAYREERNKALELVDQGRLEEARALASGTYSIS